MSANACLDCEYGKRENIGVFSEYTPTEDIPVKCLCPMKIAGHCNCLASQRGRP